MLSIGPTNDGTTLSAFRLRAIYRRGAKDQVQLGGVVSTLAWPRGDVEKFGVEITACLEACSIPEIRKSICQAQEAFQSIAVCSRRHVDLTMPYFIHDGLLR
jgi:hypothetical protein